MKTFQRMKKVHPNMTSVQSDLLQVNNQESRKEEAEVLTVWRKSLLFNCSGFTVYDAKGNLVFRVDNYGSDCKSEVVLMDAAGEPLLSVRKKVLQSSSNGKSNFLCFPFECFMNSWYLTALNRIVLFVMFLEQIGNSHVLKSNKNN
jgi:LURP-one-related